MCQKNTCRVNSQGPCLAHRNDTAQKLLVPQESSGMGELCTADLAFCWGALDTIPLSHRLSGEESSRPLEGFTLYPQKSLLWLCLTSPSFQFTALPALHVPHFHTNLRAVSPSETVLSTLPICQTSGIFPTGCEVILKPLIAGILLSCASSIITTNRWPHRCPIKQPSRRASVLRLTSKLS